MPDWLNADDLRIHLGLGEQQGDEDRLAMAAEAACAQVESHTGQTWTTATLVAPVRMAGLLQGARLYKRQEASFGIAAVGTVDGGTGMRLLSRIDPDAERLLEPYVVIWNFGTPETA